MSTVSSIRNSGILLAVASAFCLAGFGCSATHVSTVVKTPQPVGEQPQADEATVLRGYEKSNAMYHSGATPAWATRWYFVPNASTPTALEDVEEPIMTIVQTASLPVTLVVEPPFGIRREPDRVFRMHSTVYAGDVMPPSYNAMPPLAPAASMLKANPDPDSISRPQKAVMPPLCPVAEEQPPLIKPEKPKTVPKSANSSVAPTTRPAQ